MGGIINSIFGGGGGGNQSSSSSSTQDSHNVAYPWAMQTFGGPAQSTGQSTNMLGNILGLNGAGAGAGALDQYFKSTGGQFLLNQGLDGLTSKFSALGLSKSGAAMKGMESYRQGLASTTMNNYMGQLGDLAKIGLGAGGLVTGAGQVSTGSSQSSGTGTSSGGSSGGLGSFLGSVISMLPFVLSERVLKTDIVPTGGHMGGVPAYAYNYRQDADIPLPTGRFVGVMVDDVARLRPDALGPRFKGYRTVNYGKLNA